MSWGGDGRGVREFFGLDEKGNRVWLIRKARSFSVSSQSVDPNYSDKIKIDLNTLTLTDFHSVFALSVMPL